VIPVNTSKYILLLLCCHCLLKVFLAILRLLLVKITQQLFICNENEFLSDGHTLVIFIVCCIGQHVAKVLYDKHHVTGSPFHLEMFDPSKVKLESARTTGAVGDEMSLDSAYISHFCGDIVYGVAQKVSRYQESSVLKTVSETKKLKQNSQCFLPEVGAIYELRAFPA